MDLGRLKGLNHLMATGQLGWTPGHFYAPTPDLLDIARREAAIFTEPAEIPGIDLRVAAQLAWLDRLAAHSGSLPFGDSQQPGLRYYYDNPNFTYGEAIVLYCLMKEVRPRRVIEIGSGHSSCVILDTNEREFGNRIACSFVEPYPELFLKLLKPGDRERITLIDQPVQQVGLDTFQELEANDILLIDSSHVTKVGSDVNHIVFEILPRLRSGVYVHFHDIMVGFEYPREWIYQGRAWNEAYLVRAFLQYNDAFSIELFNSYLGRHQRDALTARLPLTAKNPGTSLWLRRS